MDERERYGRKRVDSIGVRERSTMINVRLIA